MILYKFTAYMSQSDPAIIPSRRTREEALAWFDASGTPVSSWAQANGFAPSVVYALLAGRTKGRRGEAHRAAVALGLKSTAAGSPILEPCRDQKSRETAP